MPLDYRRMPIEIESPEEIGYGTIRYNLAESSMADRSLAAMGLDLDLASLVLQYGDHRGHPGLRALLAAEGGVPERHVLLTPGAAGALYLVATALLGRDDHLVVLRPNYATNLETPFAIGCEVSHLDLRFEDGWRYTADDIAARLRPNTRLVSITTPHNPTGMVLPPEELARIVAVVERHGAWLLVDETYRDLRLDDVPRFATSLSPRVISVASLSKAYGLPGLRVGWVMTQDAVLTERLLAAKEQMVIAGPVLDEEIAYRVYRHRAAELPAIRALMGDRLAVVRDWIGAQSAIEWREPEGGVVAFPRIVPARAVDVDRFYDILTREHGTYVGPGHWFAQDGRSFRLGFGWPEREALVAGLAAIGEAVERATRP
jgi:aspartate/methionine/tyrosine aminotransferase